MEVGTLPQPERRDFSKVSYDEAMRRARDCVPTLRERAQQSEDARVLLRDNEQLLHEQGLFRYHQPKRFGGMELPFHAVVDIVAAAGHPLSATALGAAEGAYEHVKEKFATRVGTYTGARVSDFQAAQVKLAKARVLIDSARHLMRDLAMTFGKGEPLDMETKLRLRAQNTFAVMQCREAVETLWSFYGANAIYTRNPL
ncbi:MAG: acyl-CoA dehydrogenase family protein, partial [Betaproteobacteria bacterium]|nr:acyl-CoA dehydrogenase family protein [Betaproteobacteria bacterium]